MSTWKKIRLPGLIALLSYFSALASSDPLLAPAPTPADNPLKGLVPYAAEKTWHFPHSLEFFYLSLSELMIGPDRYAWDFFEKKLNEIASRGHQVIFRVWLEYPGRKAGIPAFLIEQGVKITEWHNLNEPAKRSECQSPDYTDERLISALEQFIQALGTKYDGDPRIGYITAGLLGSWGEWHTWPREDLFAPPSTQKRVLVAYDRFFKRTPVLLRYPVGEAPSLFNHTPNAHLPFGYHDDSFAWGTLDTGKKDDRWFYLTALKAAGPAALDRWRTHPIGGEVRPEVWGQIHDATPAHPQAQSFIECVEKTHVTWLMESGIFADQPAADRARRATEHVRRMGYDFALTSAQVQRQGDQLTLQLQLNNHGVAPFYHAWPIEIAALSPDGQIHQTWPVNWTLQRIMPESAATEWKTTLTLNSSTHAEFLALRAINPLSNGRPLHFANAGQNRHRHGWLSFAKMPAQ